MWLGLCSDHCSLTHLCPEGRHGDDRIHEVAQARVVEVGETGQVLQVTSSNSDTFLSHTCCCSRLSALAEPRGDVAPGVSARGLHCPSFPTTHKLPTSLAVRRAISRDRNTWALPVEIFCSNLRE
jgi:hypothetical protein